MIATLALVLGLCALLLTVYQLVLGLIRQAGKNRAMQAPSYINADVLGDQRSFLQAAVRTMTLSLDSTADEARDAARKVARLLSSTPILAVSPVISDNELSGIERQVVSDIIWIVTSNEAIEFAYPTLGGEFSAVIEQNVRRGIEYRYLVADSPRARERRRSIIEDYGGIEVRLFDRVYWRDADRAVDEYVIYQARDERKSSKATGYYLYPGSNPRRWIKMDDQSAYARLHDAEAQWVLNQ